MKTLKIIATIIFYWNDLLTNLLILQFKTINMNTGFTKHLVNPVFD